MKKNIKIENLDCANCAAKLESKLAKIEGINHVSINFLSQRMIIDIKDELYEQTVENLKYTVKKFEPECIIKGI